jgi:hypothetical protein
MADAGPGAVVVAPDDARMRAAGLAGLLGPDAGRDADADAAALWTPIRLPAADLPLLHPELELRARMPAGGRLEFVTDATALELPVHVEPLAGSDWPVGPFDVVVDGEVVSRQRILGEGILSVSGLAAGRKRIEVWLPHYGYPRLGRLRLGGATLVEHPAVATPGPVQPRWTLYGSSISQCRESPGPTETWPALVAREAGWDLRCLGFGGQCHLDPAVARYIRDTPADLIALCLGINVYGAATFSSRSLGPAVTGFVQTIRDGHPDAPVVVMTPIVSPSRETEPNVVGLTLADVRAIVRHTAESLQRAGDEALHVVDGLDLLGPDDAELLVDGLHPGEEGYRLLASRAAPHLREMLPSRRSARSAAHTLAGERGAPGGATAGCGRSP